LLAVSGLRISEAIRLGDADVDHAGNLLQVRDSKFGKSRLVPLHPTTADALAGYQRSRDQWHPAPHDPALFISPAGTRLRYRNVSHTFTTLVAAADLPSRPGRCHPRIHDLRHSLAVTTLLAWYADGGDVQARLPQLSTFLGHADPASTYWYLSASPELMAATGARLDGDPAGAREAGGRVWTDPCYPVHVGPLAYPEGIFDCSPPPAKTGPPAGGGDI